MRFEVLDRDGIVKMSTEHKKCIYPLATLKSMEAAGYKFRVNGKRWRPGQELPSETQKRTKNNKAGAGDSAPVFTLNRKP